MSETIPYNVIVTGCGRSGTSLLAGLLSSNAYFIGREPMDADDSNPKGYFEDREIERINEHILEQALPKRPGILGRWIFRNRPNRPAQRWLSHLPLQSKPLTASPAIIKSIAALTEVQPFCFKDPRFSYTLPIWQPFLKDTRNVCVFREPGVVLNSIRTALQRYPYLATLHLRDADIWKIWNCMYTHILEKHRWHGDWLFVHYDQLLNGSSNLRIETFLNARVDSDFIKTDLNRSRSFGVYPHEVQKTYARLCSLADFPA